MVRYASSLRMSLQSICCVMLCNLYLGVGKQLIEIFVLQAVIGHQKIDKVHCDVLYCEIVFAAKK